MKSEITAIIKEIKEQGLKIIEEFRARSLKIRMKVKQEILKIISITKAFTIKVIMWVEEKVAIFMRKLCLRLYKYLLKFLDHLEVWLINLINLLTKWFKFIKKICSKIYSFIVKIPEYIDNAYTFLKDLVYLTIGLPFYLGNKLYKKIKK